MAGVHRVTAGDRAVPWGERQVGLVQDHLEGLWVVPEEDPVLEACVEVENQDRVKRRRVDHPEVLWEGDLVGDLLWVERHWEVGPVEDCLVVLQVEHLGDLLHIKVITV